MYLVIPCTYGEGKNFQRVVLNVHFLLGFGPFICAAPQKASLQLYLNVHFYLMLVSMVVVEWTGAIL